MDEYINKQQAIDEVIFGITYAKRINKETGEVIDLFQESNAELKKAAERIANLPSADVIEKDDLIEFLLAYHNQSYKLRGTYLPFVVIGWLINDLLKAFPKKGGEQK